MAHQQYLNQGLNQTSNLDTTPGGEKDGITGLEEGTDMIRAIDQPSYTTAVQKVLSHNLKIAQQDDSYAALTTSPKISTEVEINPIFTVLQRPLDFTIEWEKPPWLSITGGSTPFQIVPSVHLPLPQSMVGASMLAHWRFSYGRKNQAALTRFGRSSAAQPLQQAFGVRDIATFTCTEPVTSGSIPNIKFQPHENEVLSRGAGNVQATYSDMLLMQDKWSSTKYTVDLPVNLGGLSLMWVFGHIEGFADGRLIADPQRENELALAETLKLHGNRRDASTPSSSTNDISSKIPPKESTWAVYPVQQLVDADTGRILATYTRNIPLGKTAGTLTIFPKLVAGQPYPYECLSAELIERIVIVTAAMVDMQTRSGVLSGLWEAGAESMRWLEEPPHPLRSDP